MAIFHHQRRVDLAVHPDVAVAHQVHDEGVVPGLRRRLELQFHRLHVERRTAGLFEHRFREGGDDQGRDGDAVLLALGEEQVPAGRVVAGEVRRVCEGRLDRLFIRCQGCFSSSSVELFGFAVLWGFPAQDGVDIAFFWVYIFEVELIDFGYVGRSWGHDAGFHDKLNKTAGGDVLLAHDLEEDLFDFEVGDLSSHCHGVVVLLRVEHPWLIGGKFPPLVFWHVHKLLDSHLMFSVGAFDGLGDGGGHVGELEEWRSVWRDGLYYVLRGPVSGE